MARPSLPSLFRILPLVLLPLAGCGSPGAPAPPSLNLPGQIEGLTASRTDGSVRLDWTMPTRTRDHLPLKRPISTEICRKVEADSCTVVAKLAFAPGAAAKYTDVLPPDLTSGPLRLLTYQVELRNHAQKSAGPSDPVFSAAGVGPPAVVGLSAEVRRNGVLLSWHPATEAEGDQANVSKSVEFLIRRTLEKGASSQTHSSGNAAAAEVVQNLAVQTADEEDPGHALDASAELNQRYLYTVQRVDTVTLGGHSLQIQGQASSTLPIETKDVFPPRVPQDLAAVADEASGAIDLSWTPDTDRDLAGYLLYRRDLATDLPPQRISPANNPLPTPNFRDTNTVRGHTYAYSVSAIDQSGNESVRSREVTEKLPGQ